MLELSTWSNFFRQRGIPEKIASDYLRYAETLISNGVPVIFEQEHLAQQLGIDYSTLRSMVFAPSKFYRSFAIPKRSGGKRTIQAPYASLLSCQRWIYRNILVRTPVHRNAFGFKPGKSIISNARPHLGANNLLKMDLENFFPSIPMSWVIQYFHQIGYSHKVSFFLASLCCLDNALPQGAPTSPYLSNILLVPLDQRLWRLSRRFQLKYTRYADDMTFSGKHISSQFIEIVANIISDFGLAVNTNKTHLNKAKGKKIVTGISVGGTCLSVPREFKRELRKDIYFIQKFGLLEHMRSKRIRDPFFIDSLKGKFQFWLQVEPSNNFAQSSLQYLSDLEKIFAPVDSVCKEPSE